MLHYTIIDLRYAQDQEVLEAIEEAVNDQNLIFNATSLRDIGFDSLAEITTAVERAMAICNSNGLSVKEHFKTIYISDYDRHTLLSKLAYTLAIINGDSDNPLVARMQLAMLQKYMDKPDLQGKIIRKKTV